MEQALAGPDYGLMSLWVDADTEIDYPGYARVMVTFQGDIIFTTPIYFPSATGPANSFVRLAKLHKLEHDGSLTLYCEVNLTNEITVSTGVTPKMVFNEPKVTYA